MSEQNERPRDFFINPGPMWWEGWLTKDERTRRRTWNIIQEFLAEPAKDALVRQDQSGVDVADYIGSVAKVADVIEKDLLLGLLPFWFDKTLLKKSRKLLCRECSANNFSEIGGYDAKDRVTVRGVSVVLSFAYPNPLREALNNFFDPIKGSLCETIHPHLTIVSISQKIPTDEALSFGEEFGEYWRSAMREHPSLQRAAVNIEKAAQIRTDEPVFLPDGAVVLFGSTSCGFMQSILETRLLLLRELFPKLEIENRGWKEDHRQPIWGQTVFARKKKDAPPANGVLRTMPRWHPLLNCERLPLHGARLNLMIYPDDKAQMRSKLIPLFPSIQ